jgi:hypothetical protein
MSPSTDSQIPSKLKGPMRRRFYKLARFRLTKVPHQSLPKDHFLVTPCYVIKWNQTRSAPGSYYLDTVINPLPCAATSRRSRCPPPPSTRLPLHAPPPAAATRGITWQSQRDTAVAAILLWRQSAVMAERQ